MHAARTTLGTLGNPPYADCRFLLEVHLANHHFWNFWRISRQEQIPPPLLLQMEWLATSVAVSVHLHSSRAWTLSTSSGEVIVLDRLKQTLPQWTFRLGGLSKYDAVVSCSSSSSKTIERQALQQRCRCTFNAMCRRMRRTQHLPFAPICDFPDCADDTAYETQDFTL